MRWKKLFQPGILVPVLLALAFLTFIFSISNISNTFALIAHIRWTSIGLVGLLVISYLLLKGYEWYLLLERLNIRPGWKSLVLSFVIGELNVSLPFGIFAQNYVIRHLQVASFARSAAATVGLLIIECFVVLIALFMLGVPHWEWIRPGIAATFIAGILIIMLLYRNLPYAKLIVNRLTHAPLWNVSQGLKQILMGISSLLDVRLIGISVLLAAGYLSSLAAGLLVIGKDMQLTELTLRAAMSIYFFSLAVVLLMGSIAPHIGTMEISGISAAQAWGLSATEALAVMLGLRLIWTVTIWLFGSVLLWLLRKEFQRMTSEALND